MFEWSDTRALLALAREGTALAAARVMNSNQTAISRRIDRMEAALGLKLFE